VKADLYWVASRSLFWEHPSAKADGSVCVRTALHTLTPCALSCIFREEVSGKSRSTWETYKSNFKAPKQQNTQTFYSTMAYTVNSYITVVHML